MPAGFFLWGLDPAATAPNALSGLVYAGGILLVASVLVLGVGLLRAHPATVERSSATPPDSSTMRPIVIPKTPTT